MTRTDYRITAPHEGAISRSADINVLVVNKAWNTVEDCEALCRQAAATTAAEAAEAGHDAAVEISIALSSDEDVRSLNARYRNQDKATNVLAFPNGMMLAEADGHVFIGDVVIAYETLMDEAAAEGKNPRHHLAHLVVHGVLHLFGYDHDTEAEAERMEHLERVILRRLNVPDPYSAWSGNEAAPEAA